MARFCLPRTAKPLQKNHSAHAWPGRLFQSQGTLVATPAGDGIVGLPGDMGTNAFAVATVNVGSQDTITASADTVTTVLLLTLLICESIPSTGECLSAPAPSLTTPINAGAMTTFSIFVTGTDRTTHTNAVW